MRSLLGGTQKQRLAMRYCEQPSKRPPPFPSRIEAGKLSSKSLAFLTRPSKRLNEHWLTSLARCDGLLWPVHPIAADPGGCHRTPREWRQRRIEFKHGLGEDGSCDGAASEPALGSCSSVGRTLPDLH